ncbi:MAG: DUF389 domain-containing protein [bacterium]|nr:DUF389 domain-containing protein [bacterium]
MARNKTQAPITKVKKTLRLEQRRQSTLIETILEQAKPDVDFYLLSVFSGIIITFGLIRDNTAVVIGGMLIAPFIWPILEISLGVVRGQPLALHKGLSTLLKGSVIFVSVSYLITVVWPDFEVGREILQRTDPTLAELSIALAAGFIGAFIVAWPRIMSALGGVLIAAALTPPLGVLGVTLALGDFQSMAGSFLLWLANLVAITFAAALLFFIIRVRPLKAQIANQRVKQGAAWAVVLFVIVAIPLSLFFYDAVKINGQEREITSVVLENLPGSSIRDIVLERSGKSLGGRITVEYGGSIDEEKLLKMNELIGKKTGLTSEFEIYVIPVYLAGEQSNSQLRIKLQ